MIRRLANVGVRFPAAGLQHQHLRPALRNFCILSEDLLPSGLRESRHVTIRLQSAAEQFEPTQARRGERSVGVADRGCGLVYRDGRPASSGALENREANEAKDGVMIIKIQPPLDVSSDSAGGIGKITPATLLLSDQHWKFVRFVKEEQDGHFNLLKCALSGEHQVAYRYAEKLDDKGPTLKVFLENKPEGVNW